jgi:hypothetical protein
MKTKVTLSLSLALIGLAAGQPVMAQGLTDGDSYVAETTATPSCRAAVLHIVRSGGSLSGVVFFKDGSGVSSVAGSTDGKTLSWKMAAISGNGPTGNVTGDISPQGALKAHLVGTNCTLEAMVPRYSQAGGNG